jgi:hypothetical protein
MAETWWTWEQAVTYVFAHHEDPCESRRIASERLEYFATAIPMRWRLYHTGGMVSVDVREWMMRDRDLGTDDLVLWERYGGNGEIVLDAAAVRRLCSPQSIPRMTKVPRSRVKRGAAERVLARLYPDGIPDRTVIDNKPLHAAMQVAGFEGTYSTAMRAAGRRR